MFYLYFFAPCIILLSSLLFSLTTTSCSTPSCSNSKTNNNLDIKLNFKERTKVKSHAIISLKVNSISFSGASHYLNSLINSFFGHNDINTLNISLEKQNTKHITKVYANGNAIVLYKTNSISITKLNVNNKMTPIKLPFILPFNKNAFQFQLTPKNKITYKKSKKNLQLQNILTYYNVLPDKIQLRKPWEENLKDSIVIKHKNYIIHALFDINYKRSLKGISDNNLYFSSNFNGTINSKLLFKNSLINIKITLHGKGNSITDNNIGLETKNHVKTNFSLDASLIPYKEIQSKWGNPKFNMKGQLIYKNSPIKEQ